MSNSVKSKTSSGTATTASIASDDNPFYRQPKKIFVLNLSWDTDDSDLHALFSRYGQVNQVSIRRNKEGLSRGFGFVTFQYHENAADALQDLEGEVLDNMILHVEWAQPPRKDNTSLDDDKKRPKRNGSHKHHKNKTKEH